MCPDLPWLRAMEGRCLARMGRTGEALEILADLERQRETEYLDAYYLSMLQLSLENHEQALMELERAFAEGSTVLSILEVDPRMDQHRAAPSFAVAAR
jgi:hypothetical protein